MTSSAQPQPIPGSPASVLAAARTHQEWIRQGEAALLVDAVEWASMHEPVGDAAAASWWVHGQSIELAGEGAPQLTEDAVAEFAAAVGMSTDQGRRYVGHALEIAYRLPTVYKQVKAGTTPVWRAKRIAEHTMCLTPAGAAFVDQAVAAVYAKVGPAQLDRILLEAKHRHAPDLLVHVEAEDYSPDQRHVTLHQDQVSFNGTVHLDADLDLGDALDLAKAVALTAEQLRLAGSTDTLDGRRAAALGELARTQLAVVFGDHTGHPLPDASGNADATAAASTSPGSRRAEARPVTLFLHLSEDALVGDPAALGRCDNTRTPVSVDTIRAWCRNADVTLAPVIDLTDHIAADHYEVRGRLRTQVDHRDGGCTFPWCTRPARGCDHDHVIPHDEGGCSCSCNITPVCRHHHRLKTHYRWRSKMLEPGVVLWTSPHGYVFLRDPTGTTDVTPARLVPIPGCPGASAG
ncbi:MAG: HNH endonuclease signature motif containing protein [Nocardioidaceae bacterium]